MHRRFSNTLFFESKGWKGLCVEAHADYIQLLGNNRPGSIVEHAEVGERDKADTEFYANSRRSLSTLDRSEHPVDNAGDKELKIDVVTRERKGATLIRTIKKKILTCLSFSKGTK
jgi:hypothetical protein